MSNPVGAQRYGLGGGDAYYDAVKYGGYTGTREQFGRDQAEFAQNATAVAQAKEEVERNTQTVVNTAQTFTEETVPAAIQSVEEKGDTEEDRLEARTTELVQSINTAGAVQVQAVEDEGTEQIRLVSGAGTAQVEAVEQAGSDQVDAVEQAGADQVQAVTDEGTTQVGAVTGEGDTQVQRVQDKGDEVIDSIPADYTALDQKVDNLNNAVINKNPNIFDPNDPDILEGRYINSSGNVIANANYFETGYMAVTTGDKVYSSAWLNPTTSLALSKYDQEKNYLGNVAGGGVYNVPYVVEAGVAYIRTAVNNTYRQSLVMTINYPVDEVVYDYILKAGEATVQERFDALDGIDVSPLVGKKITGWVSGLRITTNGGIGSTVNLTPVSDSSCSMVVVDCEQGDVFTVSGFGGVGYRLWCFVDADNKIINVAGLRAKLDNKVLIAPKDAAKIILQQNISAYLEADRDCYMGVNPKAQISSNAPENKRRTIDALWEIGGIDGNGLGSFPTNMRTVGAFGIDKGQKLVVTNNSDELMFTVYATNANSRNSILTNGWISNRGQVVVDDWNSTYMVRVRRVVDTTYTAEMVAEDSAKIDIEVVNDSIPYVNVVRSMNKENVGFKRAYSYINSTLVFERKDLQNDGTLIDSTTKCVAELPRDGLIEVKQQKWTGCFKIAKVSNGTVTYLVNDWSYYFYRYAGDGISTYYLIVANSENTSSAITPADASDRIAVYSFVDEGEEVLQFYELSGKKIAFIGDSITQGRFAKFGTTLNCTAAKPFGELVAEKCGDVNYGNFGIGGAYVYNHDFTSLYANCGKIRGYDVVFVCGGTNDYGNDVSRADFEAAYAYVIDTLMNNNAEIVVCTPVFRTSRTGANSQGLYLYDYVQIEQDIAEDKGLKAIDQYKLTNNNKFINYVPDGLHPNEMGHRIMAENILNEYNRLSLS